MGARLHGMAGRAGEAEESVLNRAIRSGVPIPAKFSSYEILGTRQLLRPYDPALSSALIGSCRVLLSVIPTSSDREIGSLRWTPKMRQLVKVEPCP